jgi:UTP:GlnB (protein PII) uridylyltransferase
MDVSVCWPSSGSKVFIVAAALMFQVDSGSRHGILLEIVQVVTDLDLTVTKAYISSDGKWFMVVFHVVDSEGCKIHDKETINHIIQVC